MKKEEFKNIWMEELLEDYPESQQFLEERDIVCVKCGAPVWGTLIENLNKKYITSEEVDKVVDDLMLYLNL